MRDARDRLEAGIKQERSGAIDEALGSYRAAAEAAADDPVLLSEALRRQASAHRGRSEFDVALELARRAAGVAGDANLHDAYAEARNAEALVHQARGDFAAASRVLEEVLGIASDPRLRGIALQNLGSIAAQTGEWETARKRFRQSQQCFRRAGYVRGEVTALNNFGRAALDFGNTLVAAELLEQALGAARRAGDRDLQALATLNYAEAVARRGQLGPAEALAHEALDYFAGAGNAWRRVECLRLLGDIAGRRVQPADAHRLYTDALALAREIGAGAEVAVLEQRIAELDHPRSS